MLLRRNLRFEYLVLMCLFLFGAAEQDPYKGLPTIEEFDWKLADDPWEAYRWVAQEFESMTPEMSLTRKVRVANYIISAISDTQKVHLPAEYIKAVENLWDESEKLSLNIDRVAIGYGLAQYYEFNNQLEKSRSMFEQTIDEARKFKIQIDRYPS